MTSPAPEAQPRSSAEFVESSVLEVAVPFDSAIDIKHELESWDGKVEDERSSLLPFVSERQLLLFGKAWHSLRLLCKISYLYAGE